MTGRCFGVKRVLSEGRAGGVILWPSSHLRGVGWVNTTNAVRKLDSDEVTFHSMKGVGRNQRVLLVSESGLYKLIMRSDTHPDQGLDGARSGEDIVSNLPEFRFNGHEFNYIMQGDQPQFSGVDTCRCLGLANPNSSMALLDADEKGYHTVATHGGPQTKTFITEAGLYSLILRSRKPEAKEFKRWITHEVLPALRKTGGYVVALPV